MVGKGCFCNFITRNQEWSHQKVTTKAFREDTELCGDLEPAVQAERRACAKVLKYRVPSQSEAKDHDLYGWVESTTGWN